MVLKLLKAHVTYLSGNTILHGNWLIFLHYFRMSYPEFAGGVIAIKPELYQKVNGHSNMFFGWGGEDDDFYNRCLAKDITTIRYPSPISKYTAIEHQRDKGNSANPAR